MNAENFIRKNLDFILDAVADAACVTRYVQTETRRIEQHTKRDHSPVTIADYAAQAIIAHRLSRIEAELRLVGEEDAATLRRSDHLALGEAVTNAVALVWPGVTSAEVMDAIDLGNHDAAADRYWTLDPIDGTKGFLRGGQYAISLALLEAGRVLFGVLGCPNLDRDPGQPLDAAAQGTIFYALRGSGAWSTTIDRPRAPAAAVRASRSVAIERARVCESVESGHSRLDDSARIAAHLGIRGTPARLDSQCKYAVVARGQADAYLRLPTQRSYVEKIWDHAAGCIIAEEAGATVTDINGRPLDFSHGSLLAANRGVICSAGGIHAAIIETIDSLALFPD